MCIFYHCPLQRLIKVPQCNILTGCIVGKGRFYKPEGGYYTIDDLNVGKTLVLFGREYKLTNCDNFTRNFLTEMGYKVRSPEPEIEDPITKDRNEVNI